MGKYYKKPRKHNYKFYGSTVSWPNNRKLYEGWSSSMSRRKYKKYRKYEYYNEDLMDLLYGRVNTYKEIRLNTHWRSLEDARRETTASGEWSYVVDNQEQFDAECYKYIGHMKPRWRAFMSAEEDEHNRKV